MKGPRPGDPNGAQLARASSAGMGMGGPRSLDHASSDTGLLDRSRQRLNSSGQSTFCKGISSASQQVRNDVPDPDCPLRFEITGLSHIPPRADRVPRKVIGKPQRARCCGFNLMALSGCHLGCVSSSLCPLEMSGKGRFPELTDQVLLCFGCLLSRQIFAEPQRRIGLPFEHHRPSV